jgi:hypothetical protein
MTQPMDFSPSSANAVHQTVTALTTALHFALKGEETLWRECDRLKDDSEKYEILCESWREQERACKDIMRSIKSLQPSYTHPAFEGSYGCNLLKRYKEREREGILTHQS